MFETGDYVDQKIFDEVFNVAIGLDGIQADETLSTAILGVMKSIDQPNKILQTTRKFGGDTDTICGIAGQISGLLFGEKAIDDHLYLRLEQQAKEVFGYLPIQNIT